MVATLSNSALRVFTRIQMWVFVVMVFVLGALPAFAQEEISIEFDLSPFFTALNQYLPVFIGLFAIIGGIAGAMALARYVINAVVTAFSGGRL